MATARNIFWNTISQIIAKGFLAFIGFATINITTHYLGQEGYGNYGAVNNFIGLFGIVSDLGLYSIAVREMVKNKENSEKIIGNIMTIRTVLAVIVMVAACISSFWYFGQQEGSSILFPLAVSIAATANILALLTSTVASVLQVNYKIQYNAAASVVGKIAAFGYMLFIVFFWHPENKIDGFYQLFVAGFIANIILFGVSYYYARKHVKIRYQFDPKFIKDVLLTSLPYGIALILNTLYFKIGSIMVFQMKGPEFSSLYDAPLKILESIAIIPLYFMNSVLPTLISNIKAKNEKYKEIIQYSFDVLVVGGVAMAVGVSTIARQVMALISPPEFLSRFNEGYYGADAVLQIIIFALAFSFINTLFGFILVAIDKQSRLLYINGSGLIVAVVFNLLLIPWITVRGAAITDVIVELVVAVGAYFFARKYLDFKIKLANTFKIITAGIIMGIVIMYANPPTFNLLGNKNILLLIPLGGIIYLGLLFAFKVITKDILLLLKKPKEAVQTISTDV